MPRLSVSPGGVATVDLDVTRYAVMREPGHYFVRVVLEGGGFSARSTLKAVDVVPGLELLRATGGVPGAPGVRRRYVLRYWPRKNKEHLFLCVSDAPSGRVFAPIHLGLLLRVMPPSIAPAENGTVIVKHQVNRSQMMTSTLRSRPGQLALVSQDPVRLSAPPPPARPTLPRR